MMLLILEVQTFLVAISRSIKLMCYNTHDNVHIIPKNCCPMCIFIGAVVQTVEPVGVCWHKLPGAQNF